MGTEYIGFSSHIGPLNYSSAPTSGHATRGVFWKTLTQIAGIFQTLAIHISIRKIGKTGGKEILKERNEPAIILRGLVRQHAHVYVYLRGRYIPSQITLCTSQIF